MFEPLKHWHQDDIHNTIQYGQATYTKIDFLNGYKRMRDRTFKPPVVRAAWKKSGLGPPVDRETVYNRLKGYFEAQNTSNEAVKEAPKTPDRIPFQRVPDTRDRPVHSAYLDQRLDDYIERDIPLTPSFVSSLRAFQQSGEAKINEATLIKQREKDKYLHDLEQERRKAGSGRFIQKSGVIYKHVGEAQVMAMENKLRVQASEAYNYSQMRIEKAKAVIYSKIVKLIHKRPTKWNPEWNQRQARIQYFRNIVLNEMVQFRPGFCSVLSLGARRVELDICFPRYGLYSIDNEGIIVRTIFQRYPPWDPYNSQVVRYEEYQGFVNSPPFVVKRNRDVWLRNMDASDTFLDLKSPFKMPPKLLFNKKTLRPLIREVSSSPEPDVVSEVDSEEEAILRAESSICPF